MPSLLSIICVLALAHFFRQEEEHVPVVIVSIEWLSKGVVCAIYCPKWLCKQPDHSASNRSGTSLVMNGHAAVVLALLDGAHHWL